MNSRLIAARSFVLAEREKGTSWQNIARMTGIAVQSLVTAFGEQQSNEARAPQVEAA